MKTIKADFVKSIIMFSVIAILLIYLIGVQLLYRNISLSVNFRTEIRTVTKTSVKRKDNSDMYLVYTEDENGEIYVYQITDNWLVGRFNSSNTYAGIEDGKTYEFTVAGDRIPLLSWYPNIYEYVEIQED